MTSNPLQPDPNSDAALRRRLNDAHRILLKVHKALIDHERERYARAQRPVGTPLEFLQLLIHDPRFAWLRPISELIVQIDETASSRHPVNPAAASALLQQARTLLTPSETPSHPPFPFQYHQSIQESPEIAAAHAEWKQSLNPT